MKLFFNAMRTMERDDSDDGRMVISDRQREKELVALTQGGKDEVLLTAQG